jgi:predicted nuclease with TOPRIM domain
LEISKKNRQTHTNINRCREFIMTKDKDLLICELQHDLEEYKNEVTELVNEVKYSDRVIKNLCEELTKSKKENTRLHEILALAKDPTHNPAFVAKELMEVNNG